MAIQAAAIGAERTGGIRVRIPTGPAPSGNRQRDRLEYAYHHSLERVAVTEGPSDSEPLGGVVRAI